MKKIKYFKRFILGVVVAFFAAILSLGNPKGVEVKAAEEITVSYKVFAQSEYTTNIQSLLEHWSYDSSLYYTYSASGKTADNAWIAGYSQSRFNLYAVADENGDYNSAGHYWNYVLNGGTTDLAFSDCLTSLNSYLSTYELSEVTSGDYIVIVPFVTTTSTNIGGVSIGIDPTGLTAVTPDSTNKYIGKYVQGVSDDIKTGTNGDDYIYFDSNRGYDSSTVVAAFDSSNKYPTVALTDTGGGQLSGTFALGGICTKVTSSPTSPFTIQFVNDADFTWAQDANTNNVTINETPLALTVEGGTSSVSEISKVRFDNVDYSTTSSVTLNGTSYDTFVVASSSTSATSISATITTAKNGTLDDGYNNNTGIDTSTTTNATMSAMTISGSSTPYSISITPSTWNAGTTIYAMVTVYATDYDATDATLSTHKKTYLIEFNKDKYTDATLTNLVVSTASSGGTNYSFYATSTATSTMSFASGTTIYWVKVPNSVTEVYVFPTWNTSKYGTVTVDSATRTSGQSKKVEFTSTTTQAVSILVTAQDISVQQTYTINLYRLDNDISISGVGFKNNSGTSVSTTDITNNNPVYTGVIPYGSTGFKTAVTLSSTTKQTLKYSTTYTSGDTTDPTDSGFTSVWSSATSGTYYSGTYTSTTGSETITVYYLVIAEDGTTTQLYTLNAARSGGDKNSKLANATSGAILIRYDSGTSTALSLTQDSSTDYTETGSITIDNIAYKTRAIEIYVNNSNSSTTTQTIKYRSRCSSGTFGSGYSNSSFNGWSSLIYFDGASSSSYGTIAATGLVVEVVITAQDSSYTSTYTIEVNRKAASTDATLSNLSVYKTKTGATDASVVMSYDSTSKTYTATGVDYQFKGIKVAPTFNTLASATVESTTISAVSITSGNKSGEFAFTSTSQETITITITVTAEDGSTVNNYYVKVTRNAAEDDKAFTITAVDANGNTITFGTPTTTATKFTYTQSSADLAFSNRYVSISLEMDNSNSRSKIVADLKDSTNTVTSSNATVSDGTFRDYYIDYDSSPVIIATTKTFTFTLYTEKNSTSGYTIEIKVNRVAAENDKTLGSVVFTGYNDSLVYTYDNYDTTTYTYSYVMTKSTSGTDYILDLVTTQSSAQIYTSYAVPTVSQSLTMYQTGFYAQFGTLYDQTSSSPAAHLFGAGSSGQSLYVTVIPESGVVRTYVFNVTYKDERQEGHTITDITVTVANAISNTYAFSQVSTTDDVASKTKNLGAITVPYSTSQVTVYVTFDSTTSNLATLATGSTGNLPLSVGSNTFNYQAAAENTSLGCVYTFTVTRNAANTDNYLEKLTVSSTNLVDTSQTLAFNYAPLVYIAIPRGATYFNMYFTFSDQAKYTISGSSITTKSGTQSTAGVSTTVLASGLSPNTKYTFTITIQSEKEAADGLSTANSITLEVYTAEQTFVVDNVELYTDSNMTDYTTDKDGNTYVYGTTSTPMEVYYKNNNYAYADVTLNSSSSNANITTDGQKSLTAGSTTTYTIVVKSEYAALNSAITDQQITITIKIKRDNPSQDAYLSNLVLTNTANNTALSFRDTVFSMYDNGPYVIENIPVNSNYKALIEVTPTLNDANASYSYVNVNSSTNIATIDKSSNPSQDKTIDIEIVVTAEDGITKNTYSVTLSTGQVVFSQDNSVSDIVVNADNDSTTNLITFATSTLSYPVSVRAVVQSVNIKVTVNDTTAAIYSVVDSGTQTLRKGSTSGTNDASFNVVLTRPGNTEIKIVVKAQDTSVTDREYTITVTSVTADTDASLKTFKLEIYDNSNTLVSTTQYSTSDTAPTLNVPYAQVKAVLNVTVNSQYTTISPSNTGDTKSYTKSKDLNVGSNIISFVVTPESNDSVSYTITIIRDDVNTLATLEITKTNDTTNLITNFSSTTKPYSFTVAYAVSSLDYAYTLNASSADNITVTANINSTAVTGSNFSLAVGTNTFVVLVAAKSGDTMEYTVTITREDGVGDNYIITYKHDASSSELHSYDTTTAAGTYVSSAKTIVYVLDRSYVGKTYAPELTISTTAKYYDGLQYKITQNNRILVVGANNFTIVVTSETEVDNEYNFTIYVADKSSTIDSMNLYQANTTTNMLDTDDNAFVFNASDYDYDINYKYSQKSVDLFLALASSYATVKVNGSGLSKSTNPLQYTKNLNIDNSLVDTTTNFITFTITAEAELLTYYTPADEAEKNQYITTYVINISKEEANLDTTLYTLIVTAGSKTYNIITAGTTNTTDSDINVAGTVYTLENAGSASSFAITAVPTKLPTLTSIEQLTYNSTTQQASASIKFVTSSSGEASQSHIFKVVDETGTASTEYTIIVYRESAIDPDTNNEITMLDLYDSLNVSYIDAGVFTQATTTYTFGQNGISTISYGTNKSYTIVVTIPSTSLATVYIDGTAYSNKQSGAISIVYPTTGNYEKTHTVYAISASGDKGTEYTINVVAVRANSNAYLSNLLVNTVSVIDKNGVSFSQTNFKYDLGSFDYDYFEIGVYAELADPKSSARIISTAGLNISGVDAPNISLNTGTNTISIIVTAEDGITENTYYVIVYRDY